MSRFGKVEDYEEDSLNEDYIDLDIVDDTEDITDSEISNSIESSTTDKNMSFLEVLKSKISYERLATIINNGCESRSLSTAKPYVAMVTELYTTGAESFNGELKSSFEGLNKGEVGDKDWEIINEV